MKGIQAPQLLLAAVAIAAFGAACPPPPVVDAGDDGGLPVTAPDAGGLDGGAGADGGLGVDAGSPPTTDEVATLLCRAFVVGKANAEHHGGPPPRCSAQDAVADSQQDPSLTPEVDLECLPGREVYETFYAALLSGRVAFDHQQVLACLSAGRASRQTHTTWGAWSSRDAALRALFDSADCAGALTPLLAEGDTCLQQWDCPEGTGCETPVLDEAALACLAPAAQGEPCATTPEGVSLRSCTSGSACFNGLCVYRRGAGQPCGPDQVPCVEDLVCGPAGMCSAPVAVGGLCGDDEDCDVGAICALGVCTLPIADGEPCTAGQPCVSPCSVCRPSSPDGPTQCLDRGAAGTPCGALDHCRAGFFCDQGACAPLGSVGTECTGRPCLDGLTCSGPLATLDADGGIVSPPDPVPVDGGAAPGPYCQVPPPVGSPCADGDRPCLGGACVDGLCRAGLPGDPCAADGQCADGHLCVAAACVLAPRDGAPCTADLRCDEELWCDGERCHVWPPAGDPCAPGDRCDDAAFCEAGQCIAQRPPGASCLGDGQCASGRCLLTQTCAARGPSCLTSDEGFTVTLLFGALLPLGLRRLRRRRRPRGA